MNQENVLLSVLIPTYNRCKSLRRTVENLMSQVNASAIPGMVEIVISNNASTDGTKEYLDTLDGCEWVTTHTNAENLGYGGNVRWLVEHASGAYFQILSDDDIYPAGLVNNEVQAIVENRADYYFVPSTASLPADGDRHTGAYSLEAFFERYKMGMALCGSNIFQTAKAREICVKSDVWFHCELLCNMKPDNVYVIDDLIEVRMPSEDDNEYWHNRRDTVLDYDTQIIEVIDRSALSGPCKKTLLAYYKYFLFEEIYQYINSDCFSIETNRRCCQRIEGLPLFRAESKYLRFEDRDSALAAAKARYYLRRFAPKLRRFGL